MILDFNTVNSIVEKKIIELIDHTNLNDKFNNPTAENIVRWIWMQLDSEFEKAGVYLKQIKLWETPNSSVIYNKMKINEIFLSIQGEGLQSGLPTIFIRTTGCNLRCTYCDTSYAYKEGKNYSINGLLTKVRSFAFQRICLTGGEPLLQRDSINLIKKLISMDYEIDLETNGSIDINNFTGLDNLLISMDIKCPSSGCHKSMIIDNLLLLSKKDQVKFVIGDKIDYKFAKDVIEKYNLLDHTNVIISPVGGIKPKWIIKEVLKDGLDARIGLQLHKLIWSQKRGV